MIEHWGIRARITLVAFVPMLALAALMTATFTGLRLSDLDDALRARAQAHARQFALNSEYLLFSGDRERLQQLADTLLHEDDVAAVAILDPDGAILARAGRASADLPPPTQTAAEARIIEHAGWLRVVEPIRATELPLQDAFATEPTPSAEDEASRRTLGVLVVNLRWPGCNSAAASCCVWQACGCCWWPSGACCSRDA